MAKNAPVSDLEETCLVKFDNVLQLGELFWVEAEVEYTTDENFHFEFRLTPAIAKKPILPASHPGRLHAVGPFVNPDPKFVIAHVGASQHVLELNKYCVYRPHLVLHTKLFRLQTEALDEHDIEAFWDVFGMMNTDLMMIYNCGINGGSSQGHKHMQIIPEPDPNCFKLFPDKCKLSTDVPTCASGIPYRHWMIGIPNDADSKAVFVRHEEIMKLLVALLSAMKAKLEYNVVATKRWIIVIPRMYRGHEGAGVNGAGMMGMVWVSSQKERQLWSEQGLVEYLKILGVPI
ncbi:5-p-4-tetraphosphate phosphorylase [Blumeria hordei DH14]|uniref:5-p-4-tetraphosphate phosphorylase n=1 Tax=Blumeria graminis f. sp. hordei (strain DH14) TaxID=546991 RepID=N1J6T9_BLUG1|nr:5-p-4-tetraphosphate phosphorylase [Blumeria hordei DH14]